MWAASCKDGVCTESDGETCVQTLGIEGRMNLGSLLGGFGNSTAAMDMMLVLGGYSIADTRRFAGTSLMRRLKVIGLQ